MSEATGSEVEMVAWKSPDGIEVQIPSEHAKSFEGLNERFNKVTTREQELAKLEKELKSDGHTQKVIDGWLEGITPEELDDLKRMRFGDDERSDAGSADSANDLAAKVSQLEAQLKADQAERQEQTQTQQYAEALQELRTDLKSESATSDSFKSISSQRLKTMALAVAEDMMDESGYEMSASDAIEKAAVWASELDKEIIDAHRESKRSGPSAPGASGGGAAPPKDPTDRKANRAYLTQLLESHKG